MREINEFCWKFQEITKNMEVFLSIKQNLAIMNISSNTRKATDTLIFASLKYAANLIV